MHYNGCIIFSRTDSVNRLFFRSKNPAKLVIFFQIFHDLVTGIDCEVIGGGILIIIGNGNLNC